eukprot:m51a1_g12266 hypothetical protein (139) ;mRNA; r:201522-203134
MELGTPMVPLRISLQALEIPDAASGAPPSPSSASESSPPHFDGLLATDAPQAATFGDPEYPLLQPLTPWGTDTPQQPEILPSSLWAVATPQELKTPAIPQPPTPTRASPPNQLFGTPSPQTPMAPLVPYDENMLDADD